MSLPEKSRKRLDCYCLHNPAIGLDCCYLRNPVKRLDYRIECNPAIRQPDNNKEYRPSYLGFDILWTTGRVMLARRIDSEWDFTCEDRYTSGEAEGDVQVLSMKRQGKQEQVCRVVNAYFQTKRGGSF